MPTRYDPTARPNSGGDQVWGDKITVGDIDRSVAAIGAGAQVIYNNIQKYGERELTEVEVAEQAEAFEHRRLAEEVTAYVKCLERDQLTILHAGSGAGKTSLLKDFLSVVYGYKVHR